MQTDLSRRNWLGMAAVCVITMAAGIVRARLAQDSVTPDVRHAIPDNREHGRDRVPAPAAGGPGSAATR